MKSDTSFIITGANGFIGSHLVQFITGKGHSVIALVHKFPEKRLSNVSYFLYEMEKPLLSLQVEKGAILIHCAYVRKVKENAEDTNEKSTAQILELARANGISKSVFISSISASPNSDSYYANQKYKLEKYFSNPGDIIVRPGLVIGNGGLFYETLSFIKKYKIFPLYKKGVQSVYFVSVKDLVEEIYELIDKNKSGVFYVFNRQPLSFRDFYKSVADYFKMKILPFSFPQWIWKLGIKLYSFLPGSKIGTDNLKGLENEFSPEIQILERSDLKDQTLKESLDQIKW